MSSLNVKGTVIYMPGSWGAALPVPGAQVELTDVDRPGAGDDLIYRGQTNAQGWFQGTTSEWQDTISIPLWIVDTVFPPTGHWGTKTLRDTTDILALKVRITEHRTSGDKIFDGPFVLPPGGAPAPVLVVPWGPQGPGLPAAITVNGQGFTDASLAIARTKAVIDARQRLVIGVTDPQLVALLAPLAGATRDQLLALIRQRLNLPAQLGIAGAIGVDDIILSVAILVTAIGGAVALTVLATALGVFIVSMAYAVVYALRAGYQHVHVVVRANPTTGQNDVEIQIDQ